MNHYLRQKRELQDVTEYLVVPNHLKDLKTAMRSKMNRLRIWDSRISTSSLPPYRNLSKALGILARLKDKLGLSYATVRKLLTSIEKLKKRRLVEGRTISLILAAAIYTPPVHLLKAYDMNGAEIEFEPVVAVYEQKGADRLIRDITEEEKNNLMQ